MKREIELTSLEICAGAGGQALGLENAGFSHVAAIEYDGFAWETLGSIAPNGVLGWQMFARSMGRSIAA